MTRRTKFMMRQKNRQFKSLKQSSRNPRNKDSSKCDSTLSAGHDISRNPTLLRRCQHCVVNENNTPLMRHGPAGPKTLCNARGIIGAKKRKLRDLSKGRRYLSVEQSDLDPLIDVNITVLEGVFPVIQNEQGISEDPSKAITGSKGSNNHVLNPYDEHSLIDVNITVLEREMSAIQNEQGISEDPYKSIAGQGSYSHALNTCGEDLLTDVNITVLEGVMPVIQNEQGISEGPFKAIASEGSNNHALNPCDEDPLYDVNITVLEQELSAIQNEQGISEDHSKSIAGEGSYNHALNTCGEDPLIDVNINVLEGEFSVIQNDQGISECPSKVIVAGEGLNNHSLNHCDEDSLFDVNITVLEGELHAIQNEQGISEVPSKAIAGEGSNNHALNPYDELMKSYTFSEIMATTESLLAFLKKDLPSSSEVDYTSGRAKYRRIVVETTTVAGQTVRNDITRRMMDFPVPLRQIIEAWLDVLASEVETPSEDSSERPLHTTFFEPPKSRETFVHPATLRSVVAAAGDEIGTSTSTVVQEQPVGEEVPVVVPEPVASPHSSHLIQS